ncbi:MAG: hypothetical protein ACPG6P_11085 [Akkermansiaceae bacterium]
MNLNPRLQKITAVIFIILSISSILIGRGLGWVTLFGTDIGYSCHSGTAWISISPGGFFYYWDGFAVREFEPRQFGLGYSSQRADDAPLLALPKIYSGLDGMVKTLALPLWIPLLVFLTIIGSTLFPRSSQAD